MKYKQKEIKNMSNKTDKKITEPVKNQTTNKCWTVSKWASSIRDKARSANGLHYGIALEAIRLTELGGTWQDITRGLKTNFGHSTYVYKDDRLPLSRLVDRVGVKDFAPASKLTLGIRTLRIAINAGLLTRNMVMDLTNPSNANDWATSNGIGLITPTENFMPKAWEITKSKQKERHVKAWDLLVNAHAIPEQMRTDEIEQTDLISVLKTERKKAPASKLPALDKKIEKAEATRRKIQQTDKRKAVLNASGIRAPKKTEPITPTGDGFALGSECRNLIKKFKDQNDIEIFASAFTPSMDNELALVIDALVARQNVINENKKASVNV